MPTAADLSFVPNKAGSGGFSKFSYGAYKTSASISGAIMVVGALAVGLGSAGAFLTEEKLFEDDLSDLINKGDLAELESRFYSAIDERNKLRDENMSHCL